MNVTHIYLFTAVQINLPAQTKHMGSIRRISVVYCVTRLPVLRADSYDLCAFHGASGSNREPSESTEVV